MIIIQHHQETSHMDMCYICSLVPSLYSYLERSWSFFFFFPFGIPIISPEFHHLFSERPILLNWHLNIC